MSFAQRTIAQQLLTFRAQLLVNNKLLARHAFDDQATQIAEDFINNVQYIFHRGIEELRQMMGFAQPISATSAITYQLKVTPTSSGSQVQIEPGDFFSGCSCLCDPTGCSKDGAFYTYNPMNNSFDPVFKLPGVRIGCSPMESVLQSNLACWYSSSCYNTVRFKKQSAFDTKLSVKNSFCQSKIVEHRRTFHDMSDRISPDEYSTFL